MKKKKGFTLVELMVVLGLVAIFGAITLTISVTSGKLFSNVQKKSIFNDDARILIANIEDELRAAKNIEGTKTIASPSTISYLGNNYSSLEFPLSGDAVLCYTIKESGTEKKYAYVRDSVSKEVKKFTLGSNQYSGFNVLSVSEFKVNKDASSKGYNVSIKFDDNKNKGEYNSIVTPRN